MKLSMDFEWTFNDFWKPKLMIWEAKMPLKISQKNHLNFGSLLIDFGTQIVKRILHNSVPVTRRMVPGI